MKKQIFWLVLMLWLVWVWQAAILDDAVTWMSTNGLTIFMNTSDYKPNNYIRRDEAAKMFVKFAKILEKITYVKTVAECQFSDLNDAHADLKDIIVESCRLGIFQWSAGKFMPTASLTNEQAVAVLVRIYDGPKSEEGVSYRSQNYYETAKTYSLFDKVSTMTNRKEMATRGTVWLSIYAVQNLPWSYAGDYIFNSSFDTCTTTSCYEALVKKYAITKDVACTYKDDSVTNYPLVTTRPNEKSLTRSFYKYNNQLFYQIAVSTNGSMKWPDIKWYFYKYDCSTKKAVDLSDNIHLYFLHIWSVFDADDEKIDFASPMQFNNWKIFYQRELWWLAGKWYFLFDAIKSLLTRIEIDTFTNYNKRFSIVDKVAPNFQSDVNLMIIDDVNEEFIWSLYYLFPDSDLKWEIWLSKINLLTQTIEL